MVDAFTALRPLVHALPPETAHQLGIWALRKGLWPARKRVDFPALKTNVFGLDFANPIGLAAGFDKNAVAIDSLLRQGFGFVETGTVTPLPQEGNPRPRLFRLNADEAVINRMGFNNAGLDAYVANFKRRNPQLGIAGANISKNKIATDAVADYVAGLSAVYAHADYVTINISSPNTQGLRALQQRDALSELLAALHETRQICAQKTGKKVPLLVKVAPDLTHPEKDDIAEIILAHGIDGLIVSNTTIDRPATLQSTHAQESGGLSGKPLLGPSTACLKHFYSLIGGRIPLIGVGGVASAQDAYDKIRAGATLVQLYTVLVYRGFGVVPSIAEGLAALLARDGFTHVSQAVGVDQP